MWLREIAILEMHCDERTIYKTFQNAYILDLVLYFFGHD